MPIEFERTELVNEKAVKKLLFLDSKISYKGQLITDEALKNLKSYSKKIKDGKAKINYQKNEYGRFYTKGNVGLQSSSLIVQSLADKSGLDTTLGKRLQKVIIVAFINAIIAAIFAFGCSMLIDNGAIMLSVTVSLSLFAVVMLASLMGTLTPLALDKLKINPAIASGPFITTTNDILGYGVYFLIVYFLLG
jgi:hypothetical protein